MATQEQFDEWAILELMGHRRLAGRVTDAVIAGQGFVRIDVPGNDGTTTTQFYGSQSIYSICPVSEAVARSVAARCLPEPVSRWELAPVSPTRTEIVDASCGVEDGDEQD